MKSIQLSLIRTDGNTQSRAALSDDVVCEYAQFMADGVEFPPIVVYHDGSNYWLADGFHRCFAARKHGRLEIASDVRTGTREDALWFALGANKANGIRPSKGDIKHAVELALRTWPGKTQREIAAQVGCDQAHVSRLKEQFMSSHKLPDAPATVTGRDGKIYPTTKPRKKVEQVPLGGDGDENKQGDGVCQKAKPEKMAAEDRAKQITALTKQGMVPPQIAGEIGISEQQVRNIARAHEIVLADAAFKRAGRFSDYGPATRTVDSIVSSTMITESVPLNGMPADVASKLLERLDDAYAALSAFRTKLRRIANGNASQKA